jgi:hypothetical protein
MSNPFIGLTAAQLSSLQSAYVDCVSALASNQSYSLNGRTLTRVDLDKVTRTLGQINAAVAVTNGTSAQNTVISFTGL